MPPLDLRFVFGRVLEQCLEHENVFKCAEATAAAADLPPARKEEEEEEEDVASALVDLVVRFSENRRPGSFDSTVAHRLFYHRDLAAFLARTPASGEEYRDRCLAFLDARLSDCFESVRGLYDRGAVPDSSALRDASSTALLEAVFSCLHALRGGYDRSRRRTGGGGQAEERFSILFREVLKRLVRTCEAHAVGNMLLLRRRLFRPGAEVRMAAPRLELV